MALTTTQYSDIDIPNYQPVEKPVLVVGSIRLQLHPGPGTTVSNFNIGNQFNIQYPEDQVIVFVYVADGGFNGVLNTSMDFTADDPPLPSGGYVAEVMSCVVFEVV